MNKDQFLLKVREEAGLHDKNEAEKAAKAVLHTLKRRITKEEAKDFEAQLSNGEREIWEEEPENLPHLLNIRETRPGGVLKMHKDDFFLAVNEHSNYQFNAEKITKAVFSIIKRRLQDGELDDIAGQLPKDLKEVWNEA